MENNTNELNRINRTVINLKATYSKSKEIPKRFDKGYLFKNIYINNVLIRDHLWIYKSEILKICSFEEDKLIENKDYIIRGFVDNFSYFRKGVKYIKLSLSNVTKINEYDGSDLSLKPKPNKIKKKKSMISCPYCKSLNIKTIKDNERYCLACNNEFVGEPFVV